MKQNDEPIQRLSVLAERVDVDFAVIHERHAIQMQCRAGCSACCRARLSITQVEAAFLRRGLATLSDERRAELAARTLEPHREMCPALDPDGRCGVYAFRPLICRSYGAPLRHRGDVALVNPPVVDVCDLNFAETPVSVLPSEDVVDQTALDDTLETIDRDYCASNDLPLRQRIPIARILEQSPGRSRRAGTGTFRRNVRRGA